jgi:rhodanese-related sulfurtransferase
MNKFKTLFMLILTFQFLGMAKAQTVESTTFSIMLKTLLSHNVKEITVKDAAMMDSVVYVDAREKKEYKVSHILNSIFVGYENQNLNAIKKLDPNQTIIVYCSIGYRSEKTVEKLNHLGFKNVYNLYGGIFEWKNQKLPVYQKKIETEQVHAYSKTWGIWLNNGIKIYD